MIEERRCARSAVSNAVSCGACASDTCSCADAHACPHEQVNGRPQPLRATSSWAAPRERDVSPRARFVTAAPTAARDGISGCASCVPGELAGSLCVLRRLKWLDPFTCSL